MRVFAVIMTSGWLSTGVLAAQAALSGLAAQPGTREEVRPPHVFAKVQHLQQQLKAIRLHLETPEPSGPPALQVVEAAPREVYFQALTLLRKAGRMAFEQVRERHAEYHHTPAGELKPAHVLQVVEVTCKRLDEIIEELGLSVPPAGQVPVDESKRPTDVFHAIVDANRQLNLMLEEKFSTGDVYQQVTLAVGYAARLLSLYPHADRIPLPPPLQGDQQPREVFHQLVECFSLVRSTASHWDLDTLQLSERLNPSQAQPSDLYDLASLLVSELAFLHSQHPSLKPPRKVYDLGEKAPSRVFQRSGVLLTQLRQLAQLTQPAGLPREGGR